MASWAPKSRCVDPRKSALACILKQGAPRADAIDAVQIYLQPRALFEFSKALQDTWSALYWYGSSMKSSVVKRSIVVDGHKTSVSLEDAFWSGMKEISAVRGMALSDLVGEIDKGRQGNLSSAIRLFVLNYFRGEASEV